MASRVYSPRDLLRLRHAPVEKDLFDRLSIRLQKDSELIEIFRMPISRPMPPVKEHRSSNHRGSDDYEPTKKRLPRQLDGTDSEWKYRGRTESEQVEPQPIPAPTGLAAQKDEGFQRFYKAVVSPTHVRVTAGGRIVPNTRGPSSPTAKWVKDKTSGDGARSIGRDHPDQANVAPHPGFIGPPPVFPGFVPGMMPHGFPHMPSAYSLMPWQLGLNLGNAFGVPPPAPNPQPTTAGTTKASSKIAKQSEPGAPEGQVPLRLSPPDQFDPSRPFFFNGQWLWSQYYPFGMPGAPGMPPPPMLGSAMAPQRFGLNPMMLPQPPRPVQPGQPQLPSMPTSPLPAIPNNVAPAKPPISSIRPSEITKKQIDVLRGSLRYFEDQLQYNKHQIDEKSMEHQAQIIRQQIQQFEKNLETQLGFEESNYPKTDVREDSNSSASSQNGIPARVKAVTCTESASGNDGVSSSRDDSSVVRTAKYQSSQETSGESSRSGNDSHKSTPALGLAAACAKTPGSIRTIRKVSSLPVTAALAPPFQPRIECAIPLNTGHQSRLGSSEEHFKTTKSSASGSIKALKEPKSRAEPYLVGQLPSTIRPETAKDTDYIYPRQLTEDELRARHMYWGKAPPSLQSGLPKFDGKDFYPPSPTRGFSSATISSLSNKFCDGQVDGSVATSSSRGVISKDADPFRAPVSRVAQGSSASGRHVRIEHDQEGSSGGSSQAEPSRSRTLRPSAKSASNMRIHASPSETPGAVSSVGISSQGHDNDDQDDDKNLIFKGRNSMARNSTRTHNEIWQSMMRRGTSSANVVQGTVTSMTAQGVLPQYAGHATASLAPAMTTASVSPRGSATRSGNSYEAGAAGAEKQVENRPPPGDAKFNAQRSVSARGRAAPTIQ